MTTEAYILDGRALYAVNADGSYRRLPGDWDGTTALARLGERVYALTSGVLMRIDPETGRYKTLSDNWGRETRHMFAFDQFLLLIVGHHIYKVNLDGSHELLPGVFEHVNAATLLDGALYVLEGRQLTKVDPATGAWSLVQDGWADARTLVGFQGKLYLNQGDGDLYEVDPTSSSDYRLVSRGWNNIQAVFTLGGKLLLLDGRTLYEAHLDGGYATLSSDWTSVGAVCGA